MKRCSQCGTAKKLSSYSTQSRKGLKAGIRATCKECRSQKENKRYQLLTEEQKLRRKGRFFERVYGISIDDYNTSRVRGLLCSGCNLAIGYLAIGNVAIGNVLENVESLYGLSEYLRKFK